MIKGKWTKQVVYMCTCVHAHIHVHTHMHTCYKLKEKGKYNELGKDTLSSMEEVVGPALMLVYFLFDV